MKFIRHDWYVAGWSDEFSRSITRIIFINENIAYPELEQERYGSPRSLYTQITPTFYWGGL